jgi:hypothetical protein
MVESTAVSYDVSFEIKKHFTPSELTGKILPLTHSFQNCSMLLSFTMLIRMDQ